MTNNLNNKETLINTASKSPEIIQYIFEHFMKELNSLRISIKDEDNEYIYESNKNIKFECT
jgi:hypothetical protein